MYFTYLYDILNLVFQRILGSGSKNLLSLSHYTKNLDSQWAFLLFLSSVIGSVDYCVGRKRNCSVFCCFQSHLLLPDAMNIMEPNFLGCIVFRGSLYRYHLLLLSVSHVFFLANKAQSSSLWSKPGIGIGNQNQGPLLVAVFEPKSFFRKPKFQIFLMFPTFTFSTECPPYIARPLCSVAM